MAKGCEMLWVFSSGTVVDYAEATGCRVATKMSPFTKANVGSRDVSHAHILGMHSMCCHGGFYVFLL